MILSERELEAYKRELADIETAYSLVERIIRNTAHFTVRKELTLALHSLANAKFDLKQAVENP